MWDFIDEGITGDVLVGETDFIMAELARSSIYLEEGHILGIVRRLQRIHVQEDFFALSPSLLRITFITLLVPKVILLCPVAPIQYLPVLSLGVSMWRLIRRDYGDAGGDIANQAKLAAALDMHLQCSIQNLIGIYDWSEIRERTCRKDCSTYCQ
jgi:hypothetical protein